MEKIRKYTINKFKKLFEELLLEDKSELLENKIYNYTLNKLSNDTDNLISKKNQNNFILQYKDKVRTIFFNINNKSYIENKNLLFKLRKKTLNILDLVDMNKIDFFPSRWKKYIKIQELLDKNICEIKPVATTDQFKCGKCKQRKCTYISVQTRSADEAATNFITCVNCNNSWRE